MQSRTTTRRIIRHAGPILLTLLLGVASQAASAAAFAAPTQIAAPSAGFSVMRMVLALILVLAAVYAAAALLRRVRVMGPAGTAELQVVSQVALGARERAVLLRAGSQQLLVGVAPGSVRLLCTLAESVTPPAETPAAPAKPNFRDLLRRSLGR
ncbi:MAG: flagellar biosynthetic protein FliO [Proteobacteria bacterium]|nr:flagellar biosynthetic protein FliO [Pseudomonadota bacterium]